MSLSAAIHDIEKGRNPGIDAAHQVRKAADVTINLARLEASLLAKAIADGNVDEAQRLVRSLVPQVFGRSAMLVRVIEEGGDS
jgi:hypothetical protein